MKKTPLSRLIALFCPALTALLLAAQPGCTKSPPSTLNPSNYTARIDPANILVDHFQGWGVSLCWWANVVGGYSNCDEYADMIFNTLKLNIVRYNIGGGENPNIPAPMEFRAAVPGFEPSRGVWNWDADQNQRWMLKAALARGVNRVEVFANSPPWWMTVSGSVTGGQDGAANLKDSCEQEFAAYLAEVVQHLSRSDRVTFDAIAPLNEPSSDWWKYGGHQEGCHMEADQENRIIVLLRAELNKRGLHMLIDAPEDNDEQSSINDLENYTTEGLDSIGQISTHTYSANNPADLKSLAASLHKPLRQAEYGDGDRSGMKLARRIRSDLVRLRPLSWCYWQGADYDGWGLLYNSLQEGDTQNFFATRKFYTFEQFTWFLRPGCNLIACGDTNSIAGYDPSSQTLAIVTVNDSTSDFSVIYDLSRFKETSAVANDYRTSTNEDVHELAPLNIRKRFFFGKRSFSSVIPAQSVTTFVVQNVVPK